MYYASIILAISTFIACGKEDPEPPGGEELITTLNYTLVPQGGGTTVTLTFSDLDGDGGDAPIITGGTLVANTSYSGSIELLNESVSPAEDITEEIAEEDADHQFFFESSAADMSVSYNDMDDDGNPVGLSNTLTTGDATSATLKVTLRHEPAKSADNVASGDISNAGGETDIEVTFDVEVQ